MNDLEHFTCRTCLKKTKSDSGISTECIHKNLNVSYMHMINKIADVQIEPGDGLSKHLCKKCAINIFSFYKFKSTVEESDKKLKNNFKDIVVKFEVDRSVSPHLHVDTAEETARFAEEQDGNVEIKNEGNVEMINEGNVEIIIEGNDSDTKGSQRKHKCEVCGVLSSSKSNLLKHVRRHTGIKPYKCGVCQKRFGRHEHLLTHNRIHTGERPFKCQTCDRSFAQYAALKTHTRTHTGEKPHMCSVCGKSFSQATSLVYHTRTHTGELPFRCETCGKGFAHSGNLNIHMRFHKNERPFVCPRSV